MKVDLTNSNVSVLPAYKDMNPTKHGTDTVMNMAKAAEEKLGVNVVGGINVNLSWNTQAPLGKLVVNGTSYDTAPHDGPYLVIKKDGKAEIRDGSEPLTGNEQQAITGMNWCVRNGKNLFSSNDNSNAPRSAIGIDANGQLIMFEVDGRQDPVSCGMSMYELADTMIELGCVDVINCDGGGSSTFISKREGSNELSVKNVPSDGNERESIQSLLVISNAKADGVFDHASITSSSKYYTPNSEVKFKAVGVDSSGSTATLPETGLSWNINDDSFGKINDDGVFTSTGKLGDVEVQLMYEGKVVGKRSITIMEPDSIEFFEKTRSVDFDETVDLDMLFKGSGKTIEYKPSDFKWNLKLISSNDTTVTDPTVIGKVVDNTTQFKSNDKITGVVEVTANYTKQDGSIVSATTTISVGQEPYIFWDYEDGNRDVEIWEQVEKTNETTGEVEKVWQPKTNKDGSFIYENKYFDAKDYFSSLMVKNPASVTTEEQMASHFGLRSDRGAKGSTEIVDLDSGEPVRFGDKSLKINYDFTEVTGAPAVLGYGYMQNTHYAPGSPTGIGMWVYIPEGTPGYTIKSIVQSAGKAVYLTYSYTYQDENGEMVTTSSLEDMAGRGWIYIQADLRGKGDGTFKMLRNYTIRLICEGMNTNPEKMRSGSIYVDNIEFIYGSNNKDIFNPTVDSIYDYDTNKEILADGTTVFNKNTISFASTFSDDKEKTAKGIDLNSVRVYIDGVNMSQGNNFVVTKDEMLALSNVKLSNGKHSISVKVRDNYGNETIETRYFEVNGQQDQQTKLSVALEDGGVPYIGENFNLRVMSDNAKDVKSINTQFEFNRDFGKPVVTFSEGYTGTYSYNSSTGKLSLEATRDENVDITGKDIAKISFKIPSTITKGTKFTYKVTSGKYETYSSSDFTNSFSTGTESLEVKARYDVSVEYMIIGHETTISVVDENNKPVEGAEVYVNGNKLETVTDKNGQIKYKANTEGEVEIYASTSDGDKITGLSWIKKSKVHTLIGNSEGNPYNIQHNASVNGATMQNITWLSNIDGAANKAILKLYEEDPSGKTDASYKSVEGKCENVFFSNEVVRSNSVTINDLTPGKTYYYVVGDGEKWSDIDKFTTADYDGKTNFYILGDIQTTNTDNLKTILQKIKDSNVKYDFSIQTGDAVDDSSKYVYWNALSNVFDSKSLNGVDMIHVIGNHELYGGDNGKISEAMWGIPTAKSGSYYSVEYGDVYVAVINFSETGKYDEALEWLKKDATSSNCTWKVLTMHVPAYGTNSAAHSDYLYENLPKAAQEAGVDFVFSGHDHTYARTKPMINGKVDKNGVVYYICGSNGEKEYETTINPDYNFDCVKDDYKAMYMSVETQDDKCTINAYGLDGTLIDTYTKESTCANGHSYIYDKENNKIYCSECNHKPLFYSGWASDINGKGKYYFVSGSYLKGYQSIENKAYYFNENGLAYDGEYTICGEKCTFKDGKFVSSTTSELLDAGWCGKNIGYVITTSGTLRLEGSGSTYNYSNHGNRPFVTYLKQIKKIEVGKGITTLGDNIFAYLIAEEIVFEENSSLKNITTSAFLSLPNIKSINLPESLEYIGAIAFKNCTSLERINISENVSSINSTAFKGCNNLVMYVKAGSYAEKRAAELGIKTSTDSFNKNGFIKENGEIYYYVNDVKWTRRGLFKVGKDYYYAKTDGSLVRERIWATVTNDLMPKGYYDFDSETGKMILKNGFIKESGEIYYYVDGVKWTRRGIFKVGKDYYYAKTDGSLVRERIWATVTNDLMPQGYYDFDATTGKMILKNGFVKEKGEIYYYVDGVKWTRRGIFKVDDDYYYAKTDGSLVRERIWATVTNDLMPQGYYDFDATTGKMILKNGFVKEKGEIYYYVDGVKWTRRGIFKVGDDYYYAKTDGSLVRERIWATVTNGLMPQGYYDFDAETGKMIVN